MLEIHIANAIMIVRFCLINDCESGKGGLFKSILNQMHKIRNGIFVLGPDWGNFNVKMGDPLEFSKPEAGKTK